MDAAFGKYLCAGRYFNYSIEYYLFRNNQVKIELNVKTVTLDLVKSIFQLSSSDSDSDSFVHIFENSFGMKLK
jgi:hypothetical protein